MTAWLFALAGAAAGAAEAGLLARATRAGLGVPSFLVRLALVAIVLVAAARAGHVVAGALGWAAAFATGVALLERKLA